MKTIILLITCLLCVACDRVERRDAPAPTTQPVAAAPFAGVAIAPDGTIIAGPGQRVEIIDDRIEPSTLRTDSARARGANVSAFGQEVKTSTQQEPSKVSIGGIDGDGIGGGGSAGQAGGTSTEMKIIGVPPKQAGLYLFGGLLVAAGIGLLVYGLRTPGICCVGGGFALITCGVLIDSYPWVFLIAGLIGAALLAYLLISKFLLHREGGAASTTNEVLVRAIADFEATNPTATAALKELIRYHTDRADEDKVKSTVSAIKRRANIGNSPPTAKSGAPA